MNYQWHEKTVEEAYVDIGRLSDSEVQRAIQEAVLALDSGQLRVCSRTEAGDWQVHGWLKKAILLSFAINRIEPSEAGPFQYQDKIALKIRGALKGVRVVPGAVVRKSAFIEPGAILMPSFVNVGAYIGEGTMVDTWAAVGSCAQIGKHVHLSGGVGIGGVLEPPQASPVIIEDHAFIGSRCIVVEGARVGEGAVLGANVVITASTKIIDVTGPSPVESQGFVPPQSVVIPGTRTKSFPSGDYGVPCALIIGRRSASTDRKTSLNEVLREYQVSV